jgi:hypothetical protein
MARGAMRNRAIRNRRDMLDSVKDHYDRVEDAIRTGDMSKVKSANRSGYDDEKREIREVY